jgi:transglutaminase-like putative cysteine protease
LLSAIHGIRGAWLAGLDPSNAMMTGDEHSALAKGRDYADISPVAGIILGSREQDVDVQVDVVPRG